MQQIVLLNLKVLQIETCKHIEKNVHIKPIQKRKKKTRSRQDSNLRGETPMDF